LLYQWNQQPSDYGNICKIADEITSSYPYFQKCIYGKSLCGRDLIALESTCKGELGRQPVLFAAAFHGMEWITTSILICFTERLCKAAQQGKTLCGKDAAAALQRSRLIVVPCVNPDGVEIQIHGAESAGEYTNLVKEVSKGDTKHWQSNARGVDINHNFNAYWHKLRQMEIEDGITGPAMTRYGGTYPESEPESKYLADLTRKCEFGYTLAFHSQGEEIYYGFDDYLPPNAEHMAKRLAASSGYLLSKPEGLASFGGYKDWFICRFRRPGFTIEVGKGINPLPISQFDEIYQTLEPMLMEALFL